MGLSRLIGDPSYGNELVGRFREALAILIKPNDVLLHPAPQERFRGRAQVSHPSGVNNLLIVAVVVLLVVIAGSWLLTGFGLFRGEDKTSTQAPPPPLPPARGSSTSGIRNGFPDHYTGDQPPKAPTHAEPTPPPTAPAKPMLATTSATNGGDVTSAAIQELTRAMTEMASNMNRVESKVDQLGKAPKTQTVSATPTKPAGEAVAKQALEARRSGPIWLEKKREKDGISYYRRGRLGEYRLASNWNIPCILQDEASNQSPGLYGFTVREHVSDSATGARVVLPQYSYGMVNITGGQLFGDVELPASLVALNLPDGTPVKVGGTSVGDAAARSGFRDQVDHRTWNVILTTIVRSGLRVGTVGLLGGVGSNDVADRAGAVVVGEGLRETERQVQQFANTSPIHTVRPGYLCNIKVKDPIDLGVLYATR